MKRPLTLILSILASLLFSCSSKEKESTISIPFEKYTLPNGLTVVLNVDKSDPIVAVAVYYHVGSSREVPGKTGFAHLFEHMMFQRSENVGEDQLFKNIMAAGGTLNGSTNQDRTNYYEVIPKNALDMALWMESDRMGYLTNTVTKKALVNQQNVVQNEKRQNYDNTPYGFNQVLMAKNLYPAGHPYSWTTIGEMEDLTSASVDDVRAFHKKFYSPNNATLSISGDINPDDVKVLVEKYFGEIPAGENIEKRNPMPVSLASTVKLYHEDNLARAPQLILAFPAAEEFSKDAYALDFLGELLSGTKKSPLYKILVEEKKLTSRVMAGNRAQELAGSFNISVAANPGVNLTDVKKAIFEGFERFEKEGFTEEDLTRIKAQNETSFYNGLTSVLSKAFQSAQYTMLKGDPEYYRKDLAAIQAVTMNDVKAAFEKYIKGKNYVEISFVPKGQVSLIPEGSANAGIVEEDVTRAAEVRADDIAEEPIVKTPSKIDRSVMPQVGPDPAVSIPPVWKGSLSNGLKVYGITHSELPLIQYSIVIDGGHKLDKPEKAGVANFMAAMLNEGTKNKTPEELEDAIGLFGASIRVSSGNEEITVDVSTLARNFDQTLVLAEEMLLEPRWDEKQFEIVKARIINGIKRNAASPSYLASTTLNKLMFGDNILAVDPSGTEQTVSSITMDDLKEFYKNYISPSIARFLIVGDISQQKAEESLASLNEKWQPSDVVVPEIKVPGNPEKSQIWFVDVPGAKQSVISIGCFTVPRNNPDFNPVFVANYKLGGSSVSGIFNTILREEKGFTYGASSVVSGSRNYGTFRASSMVRTNSTLESVTIFRTEMEKYGQSEPQDYIDFTRSGLIKSDTRRFETIGSLLGMLNTMTSNNLPDDYIRQEEGYVRDLTTDKQLEYVRKYINPAKMYYVVVGDAKTQLKELEKAGLGKPVLLVN